MSNRFHNIRWQEVTQNLQRAAEDDASRDTRRQEQVFRQRALALAQQTASRASKCQTTAMMVVTTATQRYGIPLANVKQVFPSLVCTPVPGGPEWLLGIANFEGQVRSVFDLRRLLGHSDHSADAKGNMLLVHVGNQVVGLRVDGIEKVQHVDLNQLVAPERHVTDAETAVIQGLAPDQLIVLCLEAAMSPARPLEDETHDNTNRNSLGNLTGGSRATVATSASPNGRK